MRGPRGEVKGLGPRGKVKGLGPRGIDEGTKGERLRVWGQGDR